MPFCHTRIYVHHLFFVCFSPSICAAVDKIFLFCPQTHPYIRDHEACRPLVIETLKFLYDLDLEDGREVDLTHPLARPRVPHEVMFVIGGWSGGSPTSVIETYDTRADRWIKLEATDRGIDTSSKLEGHTLQTAPGPSTQHHTVHPATSMRIIVVY